MINSQQTMSSISQIIRASFLTLLFSLVAATASAKASFSLFGCNYVTVNLQYESVDVHNRPITLSAVLYYPSTGSSESSIKNCNYVFLNNHATITDNASSPSGGASAMGQLYWMTTDNALVVQPDYLGFGVTRGEIHPYMCQTLTARNVVDCLKAAIDNAQQRGKLADNYYTINCGYSQGGGVTMAVARYLETLADEATQRKVNLRSSICGAGCYSQTLIFDDYEQRAALDYPIYLPYTIQGMKAAYGESCLQGVPLEDFFTESFLASGILTLLNEKNTDVDALNARLKSVYGGQCGFYDIISADYRDHSSAIYRALRKALKQNDVCDGWVPQHPITFYHYSSDEVVPFSGTQQAIAAFQAAGCQVPLVLKKAEEITSYGSWDIAKLKYNNLKQNHRDYGTCFYLLVFDEQLLPTPATDGFLGQSGQAGELRHSLPANLAAGQWTLFSPSAPLDGYYFGPDAERYHVEQMTLPDTPEGNCLIERVAPMDDEEDFTSGMTYLVQSGVSLSEIVALTAGTTLVVDDAITPWESSDFALTATLNTVADRSYATFYAPFPVAVPDGMTAYSAMSEGDKMRLVELIDKVIPGHTGVVLTTAGGVETMHMRHTLQTCDPVQSDLSGTVVEQANDGRVLTLGLNSEGRLGFFKYTGAHLTAWKAYYQLPEAAPSQVSLFLTLDGTDVTGVAGVSTGQLQGVATAYDLAGRVTNCRNGGLHIQSNGRKVMLQK